MPIPGVMETLGGRYGPALARKMYEWSKGDEAKQLTALLERQHPAAPRLLLQPAALAELWRYAGTGEFDRARMLAAVAPVERDPAAADALVDAIEQTQWLTKKDEALVHFEIRKAVFDIRRELTAVNAPILARLEALQASTPNAVEVPRHLPRIPRSFANRVRELDQARVALRTPTDDIGSATVVSLVGESGIGKSMLALRIAHDVADDFQGGQLYANLRAADGTAIHPGDVAAALLRQLNIPEDGIPSDGRDRASKLRSATIGKRVLVLLDNAIEHPLLPELMPASADCGIVVTSHEPLTGVDPDVELEMEGFAEADALELLDAIVGEDRVATEHAAAVELVGLCRSLPVRLRAVADWLHASPEVSVAGAIERLHRGGYDGSAEEAFALPYALLSDAAAALFRALGAVRANLVGLTTVQALAATGPMEAAELLREIRHAGLIDITDGGAGLHELMHQFAATELALRPNEHAVALERLTGWLLSEAEEAAGRLRNEGQDSG